MDSAPAHLVHTDEAALAESKASELGNGSYEPRALSSAVERHVHIVDVAGSIPAVPTIRKPPSRRYRKHLEDQAERGVTRLRGFVVTPTVYFVQALALRLIKIGVTADLNDRLKTLRVGCPDQLELVGAIYHNDAHEIERRLHGRFDDDRSHGEWFRPSDALLAYVARHPVDAYERARQDEVLSALEIAYGGRPMGGLSKEGR